MLFIVEFADGTNAQIKAASQTDARGMAVARFPGCLVVAVRQAGLPGMAYRQPPAIQNQKS